MYAFKIEREDSSSRLMLDSMENLRKENFIKQEILQNKTFTDTFSYSCLFLIY